MVLDFRLDYMLCTLVLREVFSNMIHFLHHLLGTCGELHFSLLTLITVHFKESYIIWSSTKQWVTEKYLTKQNRSINK